MTSQPDVAVPEEPVGGFVVEVLVLGQRGDFMQKLSTSSEALARFPVSQVLFSTAVVNIATLPSFRRSIGKVLTDEHKLSTCLYISCSTVLACHWCLLLASISTRFFVSIPLPDLNLTGYFNTFDRCWYACLSDLRSSHSTISFDQLLFSLT